MLSCQLCYQINHSKNQSQFSHTARECSHHTEHSAWPLMNYNKYMYSRCISYTLLTLTHMLLTSLGLTIILKPTKWVGGLGNRSGLCMATTKVKSCVLSPNPSPGSVWENHFLPLWFFSRQKMSPCYYIDIFTFPNMYIYLTFRLRARNL